MPSKINPHPFQIRKVWFIQNTSTEGPGYFADLLKRWHIPFEARDLQCGEKLPKVGKHEVVIVLGGPMSANDQTASMRALISWIRKRLKKKTPYFGICLGLQTLVKAAGGKVIKSPLKEIGLKQDKERPFTCRLRRAAKSDGLLAGFPKEFPIFQLHGETVELKSSMVLLAEGKWCRNQVVKVNEWAYGFQGHLEMTQAVLKNWLRTDDDLRTLDAVQLLKDWKRSEKDLQAHCSRVLKNFLRIASNVV